MHRNQTFGAIPDRAWEGLVEPLVKVFHIWPRSLPCCTKSSRQQPSPANRRRRRFPSTHIDPRHGDRRPLSTHSRETDPHLEALLRDQVNASERPRSAANLKGSRGVDGLMTEATLTDGCCSSGDSGAVGRALSNVSHTPRCGGGRWTSGEKDLSGADISTVPVRQPHRSLHVDRSNANMHCTGDVESSILEVPPPRRVSHPPRHSSVTVTAPNKQITSPMPDRGSVVHRRDGRISTAPIGGNSVAGAPTTASSPLLVI